VVVVDGLADRQAGEEILFKSGIKAPELFQCQAGQRLFIPDAERHQFPNDHVGLPKGESLRDQVFGDIGRRGEASFCPFLHPPAVEGQPADHRSEDLEGSLQRIDRIEEGFFILLKVPVVGHG